METSYVQQMLINAQNRIRLKKRSYQKHLRNTSNINGSSRRRKPDFKRYQRGSEERSNQGGLRKLPLNAGNDNEDRNNF